MSGVEIVAEPPSNLSGYFAVGAAFDVDAMFDVARSGRRFTLTERPVATPWVKDYDALPNNGSLDWAERFRLEDWGLFTARLGGIPVGAAAIAPDASLAPRTSLGDAVLWDLRVAPQHRGLGVGRALFTAAEQWARSRAHSAIVAETQNVNVAACRLYERAGCDLEHVDWGAYPELPDEVQLVWRKPLP